LTILTELGANAAAPTTAEARTASFMITDWQSEK
jgi:hypothetical protein